MHFLKLVWLAFGVTISLSAVAEDPPLIAAASDLQYALKEIQTTFEKQSGKSVRIVFGSSGNLATQARQGAPFHMILAADAQYVRMLYEAGLTKGPGKFYAIGRLCLFVPRHSRVKPDSRLSGLRDALGRGEVARFAIANPEHAPYGRAAREALQHAGLWSMITRYLVYGENVSQTAQFAATPGTSGGLVAYSLVLSPYMQTQGRYVLIPGNYHQPLEQHMALMKMAGPTAEAFYAYMQSSAARAILERYGFGIP